MSLKNMALLIKLPAILLAVLFAPSLVFAQIESDTGDLLAAELFRNLPVTSFVLEQEGERIIEQYGPNMRANRTTNIKSASKSVLSLLVGIAIEEGFIPSVQQPIGEYFPEYFSENPDAAKQAITVQDLLTMRAGLESTSRSNYGRWVLSDNWVEFALDREFIEQPGGTMVYSTGSSHVLSALLTEATGMSTREFANTYLFDSMNIRIGGWDTDPQGYYFGGNNLALSPDSLVKIATLVLDKGVYSGEQLVPDDWLEDSMQVYTRSNFNPYDYGYLWWQRNLDGVQLSFAWGNGGQFIFVIPEFQTVFAITSGESGNSSTRSNREKLFEFIRADLLPYLRSRTQ